MAPLIILGTNSPNTPLSCRNAAIPPSAFLQPVAWSVDLRHASGAAASTSGRSTHATSNATAPLSQRGFACWPVTRSLSPAAVDPLASPVLAASERMPCKQFDLVTLSNLCVDIMVPMPQLPSGDPASRRALLADLTSNPPPVSQWEVGGNTNTLIAAARLGMRVAALGHVGQDVYGKFLLEVLRAEGVRLVEPVTNDAALSELSPDLATTLLCFVLVAPGAQHAFCSRYDFGPWPLLSFVDRLSPGVETVLDSTAALFINGFVFDEFSSDMVVSAAYRAARAGAAVFFDPGPRAWTFTEGPRMAALDSVLDAADVVLMTEEEAQAVTGCASAEEAGKWVLGRPHARTQWCVVKKGAEGALLVAKAHPSAACNGDGTHGDGVLYEQQALKVDVRDTVGCGDSFAAAVILGYTHQHSIPATMALASAVGAATAMSSGAGRNVARAEDVVALLKAAVPDCSDGRHENALRVLKTRLG